MPTRLYNFFLGLVSLGISREYRVAQSESIPSSQISNCHQRRSWHAGRNHTVSHFKRRNGLLRVAEAVAAARLQHLHTRMNGSGAERAEKGKKKERKKNLEYKNGLFLSNSGYR